jgi:hypothetical protein
VQERHVGQAALLGAVRGEGQRLGRLVDPEDRAGRPDQLGDLEGDVSRAGAQVEHSHTRRDAGKLQDRPGRGCEYLGLVFQPRQLGRIVPEQICRVRSHVRTPALWRAAFRCVQH